MKNTQLLEKYLFQHSLNKRMVYRAGAEKPAASSAAPKEVKPELTDNSAREAFQDIFASEMSQIEQGEMTEIKTEKESEMKQRLNALVERRLGRFMTQHATEIDPTKKGELEVKLRNAYQTLAAETMAALKKAVDAARARREASAKAFAESLTGQIYSQNKVEAAKTGTDSPLAKLGAIFRDELPGHSNSKVGYRTSPEGKVSQTTWRPDDMYSAMQEILRVIYVEKGPKAATAKAQEIANLAKAKEGDFYAMEMAQVFGGLDRGGTRDTMETRGMTIPRDPVITGRICGLMYTANEVFGSDPKGKAAYDEYSKYVDSELAKIRAPKVEAGKPVNQRALRESQLQAANQILLPTEWARKNRPEALKSATNQELDKATVIDSILAKIADEKAWERAQVKGMLEAVLKGVTPDKWEERILAVLKGLGVTPTTVSSIDKGKVDNYSKKGADYFFNIWKTTDEAGGQLRGYVAGMIATAEVVLKDQPELLTRYKESVRNMTEVETNRFAKENLRDLENLDSMERNELAMSNPYSKKSIEKKYATQRKKLQGKLAESMGDYLRKNLLSPDEYLTRFGKKVETPAVVSVANLPVETTPGTAGAAKLTETVVASTTTVEDPATTTAAPAPRAQVARARREAADRTETTDKEASKKVEEVLQVQGITEDVAKAIKAQKAAGKTVDAERVLKGIIVKRILESKNRSEIMGKKVDVTLKLDGQEMKIKGKPGKGIEYSDAAGFTRAVLAKAESRSTSEEVVANNSNEAPQGESAATVASTEKPAEQAPAPTSDLDLTDTGDV